MSRSLTSTQKFLIKVSTQKAKFNFANQIEVAKFKSFINQAQGTGKLGHLRSWALRHLRSFIKQKRLSKGTYLFRNIHVLVRAHSVYDSFAFFFFFFLYIQFTLFQTKNLQSPGTYISKRTWDPSQKAITK